RGVRPVPSRDTCSFARLVAPTAPGASPSHSPDSPVVATTITAAPAEFDLFGLDGASPGLLRCQGFSRGTGRAGGRGCAFELGSFFFFLHSWWALAAASRGRQTL